MTMLKCVGCISFFFHPGSHSDDLHGILGTLHSLPHHTPQESTNSFRGVILKDSSFPRQVKNHTSYTSG